MNVATATKPLGSGGTDGASRMARRTNQFALGLRRPGREIDAGEGEGE